MLGSQLGAELEGKRSEMMSQHEQELVSYVRIKLNIVWECNGSFHTVQYTIHTECPQGTAGGQDQGI